MLSERLKVVQTRIKAKVKQPTRKQRRAIAKAKRIVAAQERASIQ